MGDSGKAAGVTSAHWGSSVVCALTSCAITIYGYGSVAQAQIIPDGTLGSQLTQDVVIDGLLSDRIDGGTSAGSNLFHSFSEFNIDAGQRVYFANPANISDILSRVTGTDVSDINGLLGVEGPANLFLLNPNGVVFGPGAELDIDGSFTTTTAESITFADGGQFSVLATGNELLTFSTPLGVQFNDQPQGDIRNQGNLTVGAGENLTLFGDTVLNSGSLNTLGGMIQVLGTQVGLVEQASVDVSSDTGGGTALIGGDYQGEGTVPTADRVYVSPDSVISADAFIQGDGGQIIVWADEANRFYGHISAQGGAAGGDGGFAEISGRDFLDFAGTVDLIAPQGLAGTLLLDPANIEVIDGLNDPVQLNANDQFADPDISVPNTINNGTINAATANVVLQATNDITVGAPINIVTPTVGLTAQANNNVTVNASITTNNGALNLLADQDSDGNGSVVVNQPISTAGGEITNGGNGAITLSAPTANLNQSITLTAGSPFTLTTDNPLIQAPITGTGTVQVQLLTPALPITLGGADGNTTFLSQTELEQFANGFSNITIGQAGGTGTISLVGDASFRDPITEWH